MPQAGSAPPATMHELLLITLVPVLLCAGGILLPWAKINEMFSPPWFSLPALHFPLLLCNSSSLSDPPRLLCAHFLSPSLLPSLPTSDSPCSEMLLLPVQNPAVAPLLPAVTPGSSPLPAGAERLVRGRKEDSACQGLQGEREAPHHEKY